MILTNMIFGTMRSNTSCTVKAASQARNTGIALTFLGAYQRSEPTILSRAYEIAGKAVNPLQKNPANQPAAVRELAKQTSKIGNLIAPLVQHGENRTQKFLSLFSGSHSVYQRAREQRLQELGSRLFSLDASLNARYALSAPTLAFERGIRTSAPLIGVDVGNQSERRTQPSGPSVRRRPRNAPRTRPLETPPRPPQPQLISPKKSASMLPSPIAPSSIMQKEQRAPRTPQRPAPPPPTYALLVEANDKSIYTQSTRL